MSTARERFDAKYRVDEVSGCWVWTASVESQGYGRFDYGNRQGTKYAHRWSYEHHVGPIPDGLQIDHLCRNRACVNPAHMEPVAPKENFLRGVGVAANNRRKTHCIRGHEFTAENTYNPPMHPHERACITCQQQRGRTSRAAANTDNNKETNHVNAS